MAAAPRPGVRRGVLAAAEEAPARQLPLDPRLRDDRAVPRLIEAEPAPWYFPSMADADAIGQAPLLAGL